MTAVPLLSVVVMGYRDRSTIVEAVTSVVEQQCPEPFEVVVVTSGGDDSADLVRTRFPELQLIESPHRLLPGGARNLGTTASNGSVVAFLAADCVAMQGWVSAAAHAHRQGHAAVASAVTTASPQRLCAWGLHFDMYCHRLLGRPAGMLPTDDPAGHGLSFDRELLVRIGPFDDAVRIDEDTDAAARVWAAGIGIWYEPTVTTAHHGPRRFREFLSEARARGERAARQSPLPEGQLDRVTVVRSFTGMWWKGVRRRAAIAWRYGNRQERLRLLVSFPWLCVARATMLVGWYSVRVRSHSGTSERP